MGSCFKLMRSLWFYFSLRLHGYSFFPSSLSDNEVPSCGERPIDFKVDEIGGNSSKTVRWPWQMRIYRSMVKLRNISDLSKRNKHQF